MKKNLFAFGILLAGLSVNAQTPRLSLFEEFTGETCPPCASTNPGLNALLAQPANFAKCVAIKWQVPIPSAPTKTWSLYQTYKADIDWRYRSTAGGGYGYPSQTNSTSAITSGVNSAPSGRIDGQHQWTFGASSDHPANLNSNVISTAQSYTSAFSVTMTRDWNANSTAVTLTVNIQATAPFTAVGSLVFRTVMVERLIQFSVQPGTNGEKDFEDVAIAAFPDLQNGTAMAPTWTVGQTQTFTLNCPLPSYVRSKNQVAFVGFIQDDGDRKVAQAVRADKQLIANSVALVGAQVPVTCGNQITPIVKIKNEGSLALTSLNITPYADNVAGTVFPWTGNIAPGATADVTLTPMNTGTTSGAHNFKYTIGNLSSTPYNITIVTNTVSYLVASAYQGTAVTEGFVNGTFPPAKWTNVNPDAGTAAWSRVTGVGGWGASTSCAKYDFFNNTKIGDMDEFYLPPMDLSGTDDPNFSFDWAYAPKTATSDDKLEVFISDNCGSTWTSIFAASGVALATSAEIGSSFIPQTSEWSNEDKKLVGFNKPNVIVKFVVTNDNGNNLYIDNVNLFQPKPVGITKLDNASAVNFKLYPNPTSGLTTIGVNASQAGSAKIAVTNAIGQLVVEKNTNLSVGGNTIDVDLSNLPSGVYSISVDTNKSTSVKKLVVTH